MYICTKLSNIFKKNNKLIKLIFEYLCTFIVVWISFCAIIPKQVDNLNKNYIEASTAENANDTCACTENDKQCKKIANDDLIKKNNVEEDKFSEEQIFYVDKYIWVKSGLFYFVVFLFLYSIKIKAIKHNNKDIFNKYSNLPCLTKYEEYMVCLDQKEDIRDIVINNIGEIHEHIKAQKRLDIEKMIKVILKSAELVIPLLALVTVSDLLLSFVLYDIVIFVFSIAFFMLLPFIWAYDIPDIIPDEYMLKFKYAIAWYDMYTNGATTYNKPHTPHYKILKKIKERDENLFNKCMAKADMFGKRERVDEIIKNKTYQLSYDETEEIVRIFDDFQLQVKDFWLDKEYEATLKAK